MSLSIDRRQEALSYLGIPYTRRGNNLTQDHDEAGRSEPADDNELQEALDNPPPTPPSPEVLLDAALDDLLASQSVPAWGQALISVLRGEGGHMRVPGRPTDTGQSGDS